MLDLSFSVYVLVASIHSFSRRTLGCCISQVLSCWGRFILECILVGCNILGSRYLSLITLLHCFLALILLWTSLRLARYSLEDSLLGQLTNYWFSPGKLITTRISLNSHNFCIDSLKNMPPWSGVSLLPAFQENSFHDMFLSAF